MFFFSGFRYQYHNHSFWKLFSWHAWYQSYLSQIIYKYNNVTSSKRWTLEFLFLQILIISFSFIKQYFKKHQFYLFHKFSYLETFIKEIFTIDNYFKVWIKISELLYKNHYRKFHLIGWPNNQFLIWFSYLNPTNEV